VIDRKFTFVLFALASAAARADAPAASAADAGQAPAAQEEAAEGWRAARWGMTVDEVLKAFPGEAVRLDPELKLADGTVVAAGIDVHRIASYALRVRFVFEGGRLSLVSLRTPLDWYASSEVYGEIEKALTARYGRPVEIASDKEFIDLRQTRWIVGQSGVDVKYIPGVVAIVHYPRPASAPPAAAPPASAATDR
jgi:hypothetical protein